MMTQVDYKQTIIHFSSIMKSFFTLGLTLDLWKFTKSTEKLERTEIKVPIAANFTSVSECEDLLFVGASNGSITIYNMSTKSVTSQQLFLLHGITHLSASGNKVLVASNLSLYLYVREGPDLVL
jgi:hypothetical protein